MRLGIHRYSSTLAANLVPRSYRAATRQTTLRVLVSPECSCLIAVSAGAAISELSCTQESRQTDSWPLWSEEMWPEVGRMRQRSPIWQWVPGLKQSLVATPKLSSLNTSSYTCWQASKAIMTCAPSLRLFLSAFHRTKVHFNITCLATALPSWSGSARWNISVEAGSVKNRHLGSSCHFEEMGGKTKETGALAAPSSCFSQVKEIKIHLL